MVNVLIKRNVWLAGASRKSGSQISTFSQRSFPYSANTPYPLFIEAKHSLNQVDYPIGFVSVSGSANGHFVITGYPSPQYAPDPSDLPPAFQSPPGQAEANTTINIGDTDVAITLWYLPAGGGVGPGDGTYIASFDIDKNDFFFDPNLSSISSTSMPRSGMPCIRAKRWMRRRRATAVRRNGAASACSWRPC